MLADSSLFPQALRIGEQIHGEPSAWPQLSLQSHFFVLSRRLPSPPASQPLSCLAKPQCYLIFPLPALLFLPPSPEEDRRSGFLGSLLLPVRAVGAAGWPRRRLCLPFAVPATAGPFPFPQHNPLVPVAAACPSCTILWEIELSFSHLVPIPPLLGCVHPMWGVRAMVFSADPAGLFPAFADASISGQPQGSRDA